MQSPLKRSVIAIIFNESKDQILLIKRRDVPVWVFPGGGVEKNEAIEQAVIREVFEETGFTVVIKRLVALYTPINRLTNDTYFYECELVSGEMKTGEETKILNFFPISQLPQPFFFLHQEWLEDAKKNLPETIKKTINQITYLVFVKYIFLHPILVFRLLLSRLGMPLNAR